MRAETVSCSPKYIIVISESYIWRPHIIICSFDSSIILVYSKATREYKVKRAFRRICAMNCFEDVVLQYEPLIYKIMNSLSIYRDHDEFYQIGLISLWEAWHNFDPQRGNFISYAYPFIKGRFMSEMEKRNKTGDRTVYPEEEFWSMLKEPEADTLMLDDDYLKELTSKQKRWLLYTYKYGLSIQEIAQLEHVSPSAVKGWRTSAREKLRKNHEFLEELQSLGRR